MAFYAIFKIKSANYLYLQIFRLKQPLVSNIFRLSCFFLR
ncbi:hypothetical protein MHH_c22170 [Mannheimia haemolytica M42548]|nr:hypothetical protein MHH_c22170 [Mannheimia haemolytica M42548]